VNYLNIVRYDILLNKSIHMFYIYLQIEYFQNY
jgi:hypothetical protein